MDFDGLSSPPPMRSSLPPSSAPIPSQSVHSGSPSQHSRQSVRGAEAEEDDERGDAQRQSRRPRVTQNNGEVPVVKDAVGESVADSFETFLKTCV